MSMIMIVECGWGFVVGFQLLVDVANELPLFIDVADGYIVCQWDKTKSKGTK